MGAFRLSAPDGRRIEVASKKGAALIAMLAMANQGERTRGWLQDRLWGTRNQDQGRASLRRELSDLRKLLNIEAEPLLIAERDRVRIDLTKVRVDARILPDLSAPVDDREDPSLQEFLEGLDIAGEDGFEEWLREQRGAYFRRMRDHRARDVRPPAPIVPPVVRPPVEAAPDPAARQRPSIAVLRFRQPASSQDEIYFAEGIAEEIITALAKSRLLTVTSRHTAFNYDAGAASMARMCADLGVDYVVQGQVRLSGTAVRVGVSLSLGAEDRTVWSERYDRPVDDIFSVQDEITASIIGALLPAILANEEIQSRQADVRDARQWNLFIRGRWHFWRATREDWVIARGYLTQALAIDPEDAPSLSLLALCHLGEVWAGVAPDPIEAIAQAHGLALRAVSLDGSDAYAHSILGTVLSFMGGHDGALAEQRRALELNPYLAVAAGELGRLHVFSGDLEAANRYSDQALAASPNDPHAFLWFRSKALAAFVAGRYEAAARHAADACARSSHQFFLYYLLAACHAAGGDDGRARIALREGRRLQPRYTLAMVTLALPFADPAPLERYVAALKLAGWESGPG